MILQRFIRRRVQPCGLLSNITHFMTWRSRIQRCMSETDSRAAENRTPLLESVALLIVCFVYAGLSNKYISLTLLVSYIILTFFNYIFKPVRRALFCFALLTIASLLIPFDVITVHGSHFAIRILPALSTVRQREFEARGLERNKDFAVLTYRPFLIKTRWCIVLSVPLGTERGGAHVVKDVGKPL